MSVVVCREEDLETTEVPAPRVDARVRVLIVDDDEAVRDSFALALSGLSFELVFAEDGIGAIDAVTRRDVDLIFLDLRMPGLDGVRTLRVLRQVSPLTTICVVSAFVEEHMGALIDLASERFDFELFRKPLDLDEIRALVLTLAGPADRYSPPRPAPWRN
jgi:CheY-like chemotaxis protein